MDKKNLPLYLALAIPVLMILLVAAFIYLPGIGKHPSYNFIYETGSGVYSGGYNQLYYVADGHLEKNEVPTSSLPSAYMPPQLQNQEYHFYFYDVKNNISKELTFEQAQSYKLDSGNQSPDDYTIVQGSYSGGDGLFFGGGGGDYNSWFLKGHNRSTKLNLKLTGGYSYYYDFHFLGWIE